MALIPFLVIKHAITLVIVYLINKMLPDFIWYHMTMSDMSMTISVRTSYKLDTNEKDSLFLSSNECISNKS